MNNKIIKIALLTLACAAPLQGMEKITTFVKNNKIVTTVGALTTLGGLYYLLNQSETPEIIQPPQTFDDYFYFMQKGNCISRIPLYQTEQSPVLHNLVQMRTVHPHRDESDLKVLEQECQIYYMDHKKEFPDQTLQDIHEEIETKVLYEKSIRNQKNYIKNDGNLRLQNMTFDYNFHSFKIDPETPQEAVNLIIQYMKLYKSFYQIVLEN